MNTQHSLRSELRHELNVLSAFWLHLLIYFLVTVTIWFAWVAQGGELSVNAWPIIPSIGWGFALVVHCLIAYRTFRSRKNKQQRS